MQFSKNKTWSLRLTPLKGSYPLNQARLSARPRKLKREPTICKLGACWPVRGSGDLGGSLHRVNSRKAGLGGAGRSPSGERVLRTRSPLVSLEPGGGCFGFTRGIAAVPLGAPGWPQGQLGRDGYTPGESLPEYRHPHLAGPATAVRRLANRACNARAAALVPARPMGDT